MRAPLRRIGMIATFVAIALMGLPASALADCTPACGAEVDQGLDAFGIAVLVAVLTIFVAVMTVGGRILHKDRRSPD